MSGDPAQVSRVELGRFLRARRARIDPREFDLPVSPRRRSGGLLREEVAALSGVSTAWYTFLEQARPINPSADVLDRIADVLRLGDDDRRYMSRLAFGVDGPAADDLDAARVLAALGDTPHPLYAADRAGDMLAWNAAAATWYTDWADLPSERRNMIRWLFLDPVARERLPEWEQDAPDIVARLRAAHALPAARARIDALVADLSAESAEFAAIWDGYTVAEHRVRRRRLRHPDLGTRDYLITALFPVDAATFGLIVHVPA